MKAKISWQCLVDIIRCLQCQVQDARWRNAQAVFCTYSRLLWKDRLCCFDSFNHGQVFVTGFLQEGISSTSSADQSVNYNFTLHNQHKFCCIIWLMFILVLLLKICSKAYWLGLTAVAMWLFPMPTTVIIWSLKVQEILSSRNWSSLKTKKINNKKKLMVFSFLHYANLMLTLALQWPENLSIFSFINTELNLQSPKFSFYLGNAECVFNRTYKSITLQDKRTCTVLNITYWIITEVILSCLLLSVQLKWRFIFNISALHISGYNRTSQDRTSPLYWLAFM